MASHLTNSIRTILTGVIQEVLRNGGKPVAQTDEDTRLDKLPMDSMDWAEVVIRMEAETGLDPFSTGTQTGPLTTVSDLIRTYEEAQSANRESLR